MELKQTLRFARAEDGSLSIEAVLVIPIIVWAILATFVFFDAFKTINVNQKATYTVADMISREEDPVDQDYLTAMHEVFDFLAGDPGANALRVSVVTLGTDPATGEEELQLVWSQGINVAGYGDLDLIRDRVPDMALGEQLIVVESEQEWSPAFSVGLASYRFREVALARPRFAPQLCWVDASGCGTTGT